MKYTILTEKISILAITLLAFLLRAYRLDAQSFWIDEALTVYYANLSLPELWVQLQTVRATPPMYHGLTVFWVDLLGDGEFSLRYFSLIFSVLAVPLVYRLGKSLGGRSLGVLVALLLAIAPYQVWHGQDARNYSMLTAAAIMSMWGFINLWQYGGWRWWLVYVIGTEWCIMTHYPGLIVIGIQGLFFLLTWRRNWRYYLHWAGTLIVIFIPFVIWITLGSQLWQSGHWLPKVQLLDSYIRSAIAYSIGELVPRSPGLMLTLVFAAFYAAGIVYAMRRRWGAWRGIDMAIFLLVFTLAPNAAVWIYSELQTPVYLERYLIPVQVGYLLAIAVGIIAIANLAAKLPILHRLSDTWALGVIMAGFAVISGWVLNHHYTDPVYAKPDWRRVVQTIEDFGQPGDAVILTGDGGELLFDFYYQGELPVFDSFNTPVPSNTEARQHLTNIAANHRRVWYTPYGVDIDPLLENWLAENGSPAWHSWLGRKRLALYGTSLASMDRLEVLNTSFHNSQGQGPTLTSVALPREPIAAGDLLPLDLTWLTTTQLTENYKVSLRLINDRSDLFAQSDWPTLTPVQETATWPVDQPISDYRSLWIPADVPPGRYSLQIVVYEPVTGQSLGSPAILADIIVSATQITPPLEALSIPNRADIAVDDLTIVGYVAPASIQPGEEMWLWLYWQANTQPASEAVHRITLSSNGETVSVEFPLADVAGPVDGWQPRQVRRAVYHLPTSPRLTGDTGQIRVALLASGSRPIAESPLTEIALRVRSRSFDVPEIAHVLHTEFGAPPVLKLLGHNLADMTQSANSPMEITLYWQSISQVETDYTIFVQLLDQANQVAAQIDQPPQQGKAPTKTWLPDEVLSDPYRLSIPDIVPGEYRLIAGMYDPITGQRLLLSDGSDFIELGKIMVQ